MNIFNLGRKCEQLQRDLDVTTAIAVDNEARFTELEKAMVEMNTAHAEELKEIRERLDMPQRRKPTMKPWSVLRSVAEKGEQFMKEKQNA